MGLKRVHVELGVLIPTSPHTKKLDHSSTVRATAGGGEMNALSLTQENIINLHKSKGCTKIHKSQNPT